MGEPNWYVAWNGQRVGPHTQAQLKDLAAGGRLRPADMVWQEGATVWTAASTVPGLFGPAAEKPAPIDQPPPQLVSCPVCSGVVADNAYMCPHCGAPRPPLEQRWIWVSWVLTMTYLPVVLILPAVPIFVWAAS